MMRTRHLQFVIICVLSFLLLLQTYLKQNYFNIQLRESKCDQLLQILNQSLVKGTNEAPAESGPKDVFWYPRPPGEFLPENLFSQANEKICSNKLESRILILIPSKSDNFLARLAVRLTWGDLSVYSFLAANYTFAFVVGKTTDSAVLQKLYIENELFGDIVITNLEEDYNKLTLNVLTSFIWASKYCGDAMLVYKTDDDSYLKLSTLEQHIGDALDQIEAPSGRNETVSEVAIYGGMCQKSAMVLRFWMELDKFYSRWRIPYMAYKGETYPPYCTGDFYFFSNSVLHQIVSHCPSHCIHDRGESYDPTRCFWRFEDVFFGSCVSNFETPPNFANLPSVFRLEIPYTKRITQFIELHRRAHRISLVHLVKNSTYFFKLHQAFYNHDVYTPSVDKFLMYKKVFVNEN